MLFSIFQFLAFFETADNGALQSYGLSRGTSFYSFASTKPNEHQRGNRALVALKVDLVPDQQNKTLTVRLHPLTAEVHDQVVRYLCEELTSTEIVFPTTDLRLIYEIAGSC